MRHLPQRPTPRLAFALPACALGLLLAACSPSGFDTATVGLPRETEGVAPMPEPMMESAIASEPVASPPSRYRAQPRPRRGVLTAGDIDDTLNVAAFQRYQARTARDLGLPRSNLQAPVLARLTGTDGQPAPGVRITLRRPGAADPFYSGHSGVDGTITVFPAVLGAGQMREVELRAFPKGNSAPVVQRLSTSGARQTVALPFDGGWQPDFLDLTFVVDTTGSMAGELDWLTRELRGVVNSARRAAPGASIRYALIVYRDQGDDYVVRNYGFTGSQAEMVGWLRGQRADGGGDYPEAAAVALRAGANLDWRRGKGERLMFHIADAPPHDRDARAYLEAARAAAARDVQIFGLGASGVAEASEFLMRQAAVQTSGRYLFLTDDSGVGHAHAEPTVSCYRVTRLTGLLIRVLRSELSGHRVEAGSGEVIREVGSYSAGVCRN